MPVTKSNPLNELFNVLKKYNKKHSRFTFEYVVIPGINNTKKHAMAIIELKKILDFNLNLIRFNKFEGCNFPACSKDELNSFLSYFKNTNIEVVERLSKGSDINAGCGQLALKNN
jgi:23S rRNA (adenine2503-C2)-methyltransferase